MIKGFVCDIDGTLYPKEQELVLKKDVKSRIQGFIDRRLAPANTVKLHSNLREKYGSTALGLNKEYGIDVNKFYKETFLAANIEEQITQNPSLKEKLMSLGLRMAAVTNNPNTFAERILNHLNCKDCFSVVSGEDTRNYVLKPEATIYTNICKDLGVLPSETIVVDNNLQFLEAAKKQGMYTALIGTLPTEKMSEADYAIQNIHEITFAVQRIKNLDFILSKCEKTATMQSGSTKCTLHTAQFEEHLAVLKIAHDVGAETELKVNMEAYDLLRRNAPVVYKSTNNVLVMENLCDRDLEALVKRAKNPDEVYSHVANGLKQMYSATLTHNPNVSEVYLNLLFGPAKQGKYFEILKSRGLVNSNDMEILENIQRKINQLASPYVAFTTGGELQPEHIFIREDGTVVMLDPKKPFAGNPVIELVGFANLFSVYKMRNAEMGQKIMNKLCEEVGTMCGATQEQIEGLNNLATLRQMSQSARFRRGDEAKYYAEQAKNALYRLGEVMK